MDKNVETNYSTNVLCIWQGIWTKNKNREIVLKPTRILSRSVLSMLSGKLFHQDNDFLKQQQKQQLYCVQ